MAEAAVRQSVTIPAAPEQVRAARAFVAGVLGGSHPRARVARLLASELAANSVRHSGSAVPGGVVTVTVIAGGHGVRVEVTDRGGDGVPVLVRAGGGEAEGAEGYAWWTRLPRGGGISGAAGFPRHGSSSGRTESAGWTWRIPFVYLAFT